MTPRLPRPPGSGRGHASTSIDVRRQYGRLAARYDRRWSRYVDRSIAETLRRAAPASGEPLLDVGCGTGVLLDRVRRPRSTALVAGVDLSPEMIAVARRRLAGAPLFLALADVRALPFRPAVFEVVVSTSAFHYWHDPRLALQEVRRVLAPSGRIVITDWCREGLACRLYDFALRQVDRAHRRSYTRGECRGLLAGAGFRVERVDRFRPGGLWELMTAVARSGEVRTAETDP